MADSRKRAGKFGLGRFDANQGAFDLPMIWNALAPMSSHCNESLSFRPDVMCNTMVIVPLCDERGLDVYENYS